MCIRDRRRISQQPQRLIAVGRQHYLIEAFHHALPGFDMDMIRVATHPLHRTVQTDPVTAVSYTPLDVYKRQARVRGMRKKRNPV